MDEIEEFSCVVLYDHETDPGGEKAAAEFHLKYSSHPQYDGTVFLLPKLKD